VAIVRKKTTNECPLRDDNKGTIFGGKFEFLYV
jgi:hypothetical protein